MGDLGYYTIPVKDLGRGKAFWGPLMGWQFGDQKHEGYAHADGGAPPCGLVESNGEHLNAWFRVDDLKLAIARVRELGGETDEPEQSNSGWSASCRDDQGFAFNLWEPAEGYR
jgi:predicted enzyme related to lactoylglutathione lyase